MAQGDEGGGHGIAAASIAAAAVIIAAVIGIAPSIIGSSRVSPPTFEPGPSIGPPPAVKVFLSKESGPAGAEVNVSGQGFAAGEAVQIMMQTIILATTTADDSGQFANVGVTIPKGLNGPEPKQYDMVATGTQSARWAIAPFTLTG